MLVDENPVGLDAARAVQIGRAVAARPAAPGAGGRATGRAGNGEDRVSMDGEIGHVLRPFLMLVQPVPVLVARHRSKGIVSSVKRPTE